MVIQVAFIVAQLLLSYLVTTINFVSQTVTKNELLLFKHLSFLKRALILNICGIRSRSAFAFFNHTKPGMVCNGVWLEQSFFGLIVLELHP